MADMYGAICSNSFIVKDVAAFETWFDGYYFGDEVTVSVIDKESRELCFAGYAQYPSAYPRRYNTEADDYEEVEDLKQFASELAEYLEEGEVLSVVAGGHEKLRYVSFDQLIIAASYPDYPIYRIVSSDADHDSLIALVESHKRESDVSST